MTKKFKTLFNNKIDEKAFIKEQLEKFGYSYDDSIPISANVVQCLNFLNNTNRTPGMVKTLLKRQ